MTPISRHQCLVYGGPPSLQLTALAGIVRLKLLAGYRCLYLNSPTMLAGLRSYLAAIDVDVIREQEKGSLVLSSAQSHVAEGVFDADGMIATIEQSVQQALADGYNGLFATGDMTWELGPERDAARLLRYERSLEELFHKYPQLSGICQYHTDTLPQDFAKLGMEAHGAFFINETLSIANPGQTLSIRG